MPSCFDVANYFLSCAHTDDVLTHMKLQKLCAYAQALSLALNNHALFSEHLEAWEKGPVIREIHKKYSVCGEFPPRSDEGFEPRAPFTHQELFILDLVNNYYGRYAPFVLSDMSHNDFSAEFGTKAIIPHDAIRKSFVHNKIVKKLEAV